MTGGNFNLNGGRQIKINYITFNVRSLKVMELLRN